MYGIEPRYNEPRYNEFRDITNIIRKPKRKIPRYNELQCQHATEDKCITDQQATNPLILMVKRQQPLLHMS